MAGVDCRIRRVREESVGDRDGEETGGKLGEQQCRGQEV